MTLLDKFMDRPKTFAVVYSAVMTLILLGISTVILFLIKWVFGL